MNGRITLFANNLYTYKHTSCLSFPDVKNLLHNILKDFVVSLLDKATRNIALFCKRFYASAIAKKLRLYNDSFADDHDQQLTANNIANKILRDLRIKFGIYDTIFLLEIIDCIICTGC